MPTYDYQCRSCDRVTEVIHAMTEDGPSVCEHCGGQLRRVLFPTGIIFKGSGFYRTDSRAGSDGAGTAARSAKSEPSTPASSSSDGASGATSAASTPSEKRSAD